MLLSRFCFDVSFYDFDVSFYDFDVSFYDFDVSVCDFDVSVYDFDVSVCDVEAIVLFLKEMLSQDRIFFIQKEKALVLGKPPIPAPCQYYARTWPSPSATYL